MKQEKMKRITVLAVMFAFILNCLCACSLAFPWGNKENEGQEVDFTQMTYVAFGDSITWGEDGATHEQMKAPYPQLVADELELKNVQNYGKRGASITYSSNYIGTQVIEASAKADIVSVMIGVNDFRGAHTLGKVGDTSVDCIYGGLDYLAKELLKKYPNAFIFFMTPLNQTEAPATNSAGYTLAEVCNAVKVVCEANHIAVLDMNALVDFSAQTDPNSDGLHPTQKFTANYIAPQITQFITSNVQ